MRIPKSFFSLCVLILALARPAGAQTSAVPDSSLGAGKIFISDLGESLLGAAYYFERPAYWSPAGWSLFGGTVAGTTVMVHWADDPMRQMMLRNRGAAGDRIADFGNYFGTGAPGGVAAVALYLTGLTTGNSHVRLMGRHIVQTLAYAGVSTTILKYVFGRERPYLNDGPDRFHGPSANNDWNSLPSGHVTVATAVCSSLAGDIDNTWASIGLYAVAGTTVFARMYSDKHWLSDTFLAGVIGTTTGYWVTHFSSSYIARADSSMGSLELFPSGAGLTMVLHF